MNSIKVLSFLLVVGLSQSAPQISQQGVVTQVLGQLQPEIQRILESTLGGRRQTIGIGRGTVGTASTSNFGQGATRFTQGSTSNFGQTATGFAQGSTSNFGQGATRFSQGSTANQGSSGLSASQLTSSVVSSLQPSIATAVAQALQGRQRPVAPTSNVAALTTEEEERINAAQSANAQYEFGYKVGDDDKQTYIAHEESRNGENVEGKYNYVDPTGSLVTVNYQAGPMGYTENREVQEGAVQIDARNIPQPWTGPLAGVSSSSSGSTASSGSASSSLSQSDLIAQILRAIQPQITTAVQSAIGSSSATSTSSFNQGSFGSQSTSSSQSDLIAQILRTIQPQISTAVQSAIGSRSSGSTSSFNANRSSGNIRTGSTRGSNSQTNLVSTILGQLQPQISGAVQSALAGSRRTAVRRPVAPVPAPSSGVNDLFGGSGVRIQTPEFNIEY